MAAGFIVLFAVLSLASPLTARITPPDENLYTWQTLNSAEKSLQKANEPWKLVEPMLEAGDRATVVKYLEGLSSRQEPTRRRIAYLLKLYEGDYPGAAEEISHLPASDPWTAGQKDYINRLLRAAEGFVENPSEHFRVRTVPENAFLAESALRALEKSYTKMSEAFGALPSTMVVVEIYPTVERFSAASTLPEETLERSGAIGICKFGRLMILSPQQTPMGYRWLDALAHEYGHLVINMLSGSLCPLWLHEGVARYYETGWRRADGFSHPPADETRLAEAALQSGTTEQEETPENQLIPFKRMEPSMVYLKDQEEVSLAFTEVSDAVDYLAERFGEAKLGELLRSFRRYPREEAFRMVLDLTEEEFESAWKESLKEREWKISKGAMGQVIRLGSVKEDEFVGADLRGHIRLGDRLRQQEQFEAAIVQYKKALNEEPDNGVALTKLARAYLALEDETGAAEALRRAVEKNPSYVTPAVMLGELYYEQGKYEEAQPVLYEALEINPFHPKIHELLGMIALDVGQFSAARKAIKQSLELDPTNEELKGVLRAMPASPK